MPIYEYQCPACGFELEKLQKLSDPPLQDCPSCKAVGMRKLVSKAAFRLKGGGWYETDFKTNTKRNVVEGETKTKDTDSKDKDSKDKSPSATPSSGAATEKSAPSSDKPKSSDSTVSSTTSKVKPD